MYVPGALLQFGDGHAAAQGAGELTGNALETSMDIEFDGRCFPHHFVAIAAYAGSPSEWRMRGT